MELQKAEEMPETVSKKTRWGLLALMAAVFAAAAIAGNFYHPWDEALENSAAGVLDFSKLEEASSVAGNGHAGKNNTAKSLEAHAFRDFSHMRISAASPAESKRIQG